MVWVTVVDIAWVAGGAPKLWVYVTPAVAAKLSTNKSYSQKTIVMQNHILKSMNCSPKMTPTPYLTHPKALEVSYSTSSNSFIHKHISNNPKIKTSSISFPKLHLFSNPKIFFRVKSNFSDCVVRCLLGWVATGTPTAVVAGGGVGVG